MRACALFLHRHGLAGGANPVLEWLRLPVDVLFIVRDVPPILYLWWLSIRYMVPAVKPTEEEREILSGRTQETEIYAR